MKTGTTARLKPPPEVRGIVVERRINPATDEIEVLLEWPEGGNTLRRWFDADQLEEVAQ